MCLVTRACPCDAENPATQEDDHAALCWRALPTTATRHPASTYRKAMPVRQPLEMPGRYDFHSNRPAPWPHPTAEDARGEYRQIWSTLRDRPTEALVSVWR